MVVMKAGVDGWISSYPRVGVGDCLAGRTFDVRDSMASARPSTRRRAGVHAARSRRRCAALRRRLPAFAPTRHVKSLEALIDIEKAECMVQADYDRDLGKVRASEGGTDGLNAAVRG